MQIRSILQLYEQIPDEQRIIVDVLRQIITETLPGHCREKFFWNVPCFHGRRAICIVWPAAIPRGGFKEGVLLGFCHGNRLNDVDQYLTRGTNKQVFYKIFRHVDEIDEQSITKLLKEATRIDTL